MNSSSAFRRVFSSVDFIVSSRMILWVPMAARASASASRSFESATSMRACMMKKDSSAEPAATETGSNIHSRASVLISAQYNRTKQRKTLESAESAAGLIDCASGPGVLQIEIRNLLAAFTQDQH